MSRVEGIENVVRFHNYTTIAVLEELASVNLANHSSMKQVTFLCAKSHFA
jgi:hypothetical protein